MFNSLAPRYELVNTLFSAGRDAYWRRRAVELARVAPDDDVLDVACGTGDFARAFARPHPRSVIGCDFAHDMLKLALARGETPGDSTVPIRWCEGDAQNLPFESARFSIVSCAFGVRNLADLDRGLREMLRVLRTGGRAVILEFTRPRNGMARAVYEVYSSRIMPVLASWVSRDRTGAYRYLPRSVVSFLNAEQMIDRLTEVGFSDVTSTPLTMGVVTVYVARRP